MCAPEEQRATLEEARTKPPGQLPFPRTPCSPSLRYFSYAVLLGREPSLNNTFNGVGRDKALLSERHRAPSVPLLQLGRGGPC